ncbi:hypothetical protein CH063_01303 [Colletotrichum higginsianum]|uniref:Uncharacterized protein n=1 Tax=Colletotrichum higginsianum (strain IMI 349063) TaxID=759273 RepID=H1V5A6_COLHI|nr:hypothetical protein CH063_01303 [Colletotrichum higginsianum]
MAQKSMLIDRHSAQPGDIASKTRHAPVETTGLQYHLINDDAKSSPYLRSIHTLRLWDGPCLRPMHHTNIAVCEINKMRGDKSCLGNLFTCLRSPRQRLVVRAWCCCFVVVVAATATQNIGQQAQSTTVAWAQGPLLIPWWRDVSSRSITSHLDLSLLPSPTSPGVSSNHAAFSFGLHYTIWQNRFGWRGNVCDLVLQRSPVLQ